MHDVLREESAQATVEYAIVTVALLSIVLAIAGLGVPAPMGAWRRWLSGRHPMALPRRRLSRRCGRVRTSRCIDAAREDRARVYGRGRFFAADVSDTHPSRAATGVPALYARGHGVCRRRDRAAHDHDDGGGRRS